MGSGEIGAGLIGGGTDAPYERPAARGHVVRARVEDALAPATALRLIVISENRLYREGLAHLLGAQPSLDVVGAAGSAAELMLHDADVALVDVARPPGLRSVAELRRLRVDLPVIVVSVPELEGIVVQCAEIGVAGYVTTSGSADELVAAAAAWHAERSSARPAWRRSWRAAWRPSRASAASPRATPA